MMLQSINAMRDAARPFALAGCLLLAGCDSLSMPTEHSSQSKEALHALDVGPLESNRAIQVVEELFFADGITMICGDYPVPQDLQGLNTNADDTEQRVGKASYDAVLAEVERLHPGQPTNRDAAQHIWEIMMEQAWARGRGAAKTRGCAAMEPEVAAARCALRSWRPAAQPDPPSRWHDR